MNHLYDLINLGFKVIPCESPCNVLSGFEHTHLFFEWLLGVYSGEDPFNFASRHKNSFGSQSRTSAWCLQKQTPQKSLEKLGQFLEPFEVVPFDETVCYEYAAIRKQTEEEGKVVGPNDLLIASIAKFHEGILVTRNTKEFTRIKDFRIENWWEN